MLWMLPLGVTLFTATVPLTAGEGSPLLFVLSLLTCLIPFIILVTGIIRGKGAAKAPPENRDRPHHCAVQHFYDLGIGDLILLY